MRRRLDLRAVGPGLVLVALGFGGCRSGAARIAESAVPLAAGAHDIAVGSRHAYHVHLDADDYLRVVVMQIGVDVELQLTSASGDSILKVDSPNGSDGPEEIAFVAARGADYFVTVVATEGGPGGYRLDPTVDAEPSAADRARAEGLGLYLKARSQTERGDAIADYRRALGHLESIDAPLLRGRAHRRLGTLLSRERREGEALDARLTAHAAMAPTAGSTELAPLINEVASSYDALGNVVAARAWYARVLDLSKGGRLPQARAVAQQGLGVLNEARGHTQTALGHYRAALAIWSELDDDEHRAEVLYLLGDSHVTLGHFDDALDLFEQSRTLRGTRGDALEAVTLSAIGRVQHLQGEYRPAVEWFAAALAIYATGVDPRGGAVAVELRGNSLQAIGDLDGARAAYQTALAAARAAAHVQDEGYALASLGRLETEAGQVAAARRDLGKARELLTQAGDRNGQASTLLGIAQLERDHGDLVAAGVAAAAGVELVEGLRGEIVATDSRNAYLATRHGLYATQVDILMRMHAADRQVGHDRAAFELSERARARGLLDELAETRSRRSELDLDALDRGAPHSEVSASDDPTPPLLSLAQIRADLLDDQTRLLAYALGDDRSFLWVIGTATLATYELPARDLLTDLGRRVYAQQASPVSGLPAGQAQLDLDRLSRWLLPEGADLGGRRLLISADGVIHYLPFAALLGPPVDGSGARSPLVASHDVVMIPSASVLAILRRHRDARPPAPKLLAVLADPVFRADDQRLGSAGEIARGATATREVADDALERATRELGLTPDSLPRLRWSGGEGSGIAELFAADRSLVAFGFDANRELVLGGALADYRFVHFATHGLISARHPELSGLVLSRFDHQDKPREGFIAALDLGALRLNCEQVTLSACRTALGEEVRGEGLVGLTRAFLYAGAARVVVSLWNVSDEATADLMRRFYRQMVVEGRSPDAALSHAQREVRADPRWGSPYYWAGVQLVGDWRDEVRDDSGG